MRSGNVHSADSWRAVLEPVVARYRDTVKRRSFRAGAAFALPEVYSFLEAEGFGYAIRLPANAVLQRCISHLLKRPVGRPPHEVRRYYASFSYRAASWDGPRREHILCGNQNNTLTMKISHGHGFARVSGIAGLNLYHSQSFRFYFTSFLGCVSFKLDPKMRQLAKTCRAVPAR